MSTSPGFHSVSARSSNCADFLNLDYGNNSGFSRNCETVQNFYINKVVLKQSSKLMSDD